MDEPHWSTREPAIPVTDEMIRAGATPLHSHIPLRHQAEQEAAARAVVSSALKVVTRDDLRKALGE